MSNLTLGLGRSMASGEQEPAMTLADLILAAFTVCNGARVLAYVPQIICVMRDRNGASGISCTTWGLFAAANTSTAIYAIALPQDWNMGAVSAANAVFCFLILTMTTYKRIRHRGCAR